MLHELLEGHTGGGLPIISWKMSRGDPKLAVRLLFSHFLGEPMSTAHLSFRTQEVRGGFQCTIRQVVWGESEFVGDVRESRKKAEHDAFHCLLYSYRHWIRWSD